MDHSKWSIKFTWVNTVDIFLIQVRINYYKKALKSIKIKKNFQIWYFNVYWFTWRFRAVKRFQICKLDCKWGCKDMIYILNLLKQFDRIQNRIIVSECPLANFERRDLYSKNVCYQMLQSFYNRGTRRTVRQSHDWSDEIPPVWSCLCIN